MKRSCVVFTLTVIATLLITTVVTKMLSIAWRGPEILRLDIKGCVVDGAGQVVPAAHVIVSLSELRIEGPTHCFGIIADDNGCFHLRTDTGLPLSSDLRIGATGPNDEYGGPLQQIVPSIKNGVLNVTNVNVVIRPLPAELRDNPSFKYNSFASYCVGHAYFHFVGPGWTPEF